MTAKEIVSAVRKAQANGEDVTALFPVLIELVLKLVSERERLLAMIESLKRRPTGFA